MTKKKFNKKQKRKDVHSNADLTFVILKPNSAYELIFNTSIGEWEEFHIESNTTTSLENIKTPIQGNEFLILCPRMTDAVSSCLANFSATLNLLDDIRIFGNPTGAYIIVTRIESVVVSRIWDSIADEYGYTT